MGVTSILLVVALGSTGYGHPGHDWAAQCFLTHNLANFEGGAYSGAYEYDILYIKLFCAF